MKDYEAALAASINANQKRQSQANNAHKNVSLSIQSRPIKATLINDIGSFTGSAERRHAGNVSSQNHDK